ncbi:MAG TPA: integrase arm-type DNA-binding domain-containing protein [Gallionella sp.]|nr:integrase arm-type DNA-binding domain-containing protein [Gallionella sp.]
MPLSNTKIKNAKPGAKPAKLVDKKGLYLLVAPAGGKWWRLKYRFGGKEKLLSLGTYPEVSLKDARQRRDDARKLLADSVDPSENRKAVKAAGVALAENSFEIVACEWLSKFSKNWKESHTSTIRVRLVNDVFPWLGARPIGEINAPELLTILRRIESRGALDSAHRVSAICGQVFRYAIATGRAERDPSADLKGSLPPHRGKHLAAITDPVKIGKLMRDIDGYRGSFTVRCALRLAPMVFLRPIELSRAEWSEIDLDKAEWRIPADKMKMKALHIVPLPTQAVAILRELHPLTGAGKYLFPNVRTSTLPMAGNTILAAIRSMGYTSAEMTAHGFRHMASTLLNEQGFNADAIERQLAHKASGVRATYNAAEYLPERRRMMQHWADYLDGLKTGAEVITLRGNAA